MRPRLTVDGDEVSVEGVKLTACAEDETAPRPGIELAPAAATEFKSAVGLDPAGTDTFESRVTEPKSMLTIIMLSGLTP